MLECSPREQPGKPAFGAESRTARSLLHLIALHHEPTYLHLRQVAHYAAAFAEHLQLDPHQVKTAYTAGLLHDIGKLNIPLEILAKPSSLTDAERTLMQTHPARGAQMVRQAGAPGEVCEAVHYHHEWWDGRGYPTGRSGSEIPLLARMIALADAFDSMTTHRPYRKVVSMEAAFGELARCTGSQFAPDLTPEFIAMIQKPNASLRSRLPYTPFGQ